MIKTNKILSILYFLLYFPFIILNCIFKDNIIREDIKKWAEICNLSNDNILYCFIYLFSRFKEFRYLYYYRLSKKSYFTKRTVSLLKIFFRELPTLYITSSKIGIGLFLQHGFGTIISAEEIGENCWINQNVTIGFDEKLRAPIIGDNVRVSTGAVILGGIKIGSNTVIGPNSLVVRSIIPNSVVISQPSYIAKKDGKFVLEKLDSV